MPIVNLYPHGATAGCPPGANGHKRTKRGKVVGWSPASIRNNTVFLYSVDESRLTGQGFAITLTLRRCPETSDDWQRLLNTYLQRLYRRKAIRSHVLTEWQRRGAPHLHGAIWFPSGEAVGWDTLVTPWLEVAKDYEPAPGSQTAQPIDNLVGWFQYVSKHGARGLHHYQRSPDNVPAGWTKTGRMWFKRGDWPTREAMRVNLDMPGYHRFRRLVRAYRLADARTKGPPKRIAKARSMLKSPDRELCSVRGVSEWIGLDESLRLLEATHVLGHRVVM